MGLVVKGCTTPADRLRALTGGRRIKPTSLACRRSRRPEPGRHSTYQAGKPVQTNRASSVFGAENLLAHGDSALVERLGLGVPAGVLVEQGEVAKPGGEVGMLGAEGTLADSDGAPVQRLGLGVAVGVHAKPSKVVELSGEIRMLGAAGVLGDGDSAPME